MLDADSDAELIRLARRHPRDMDVRAELWDRADMDAEYCGSSQLAADLTQMGINRPTIVHASTEALTDRYRKRYEN
jgi:hypothetical protein